MPVSAVTFAYSDHQAFIDVGLPATGVGEEFVAKDHTPHYHKATDVFANVSFDHLSFNLPRPTLSCFVSSLPHVA